ncbi:MAG: LuxR family transcriptional regulator [Bacteroidetes bacterium]|nr:LuxR family transcriptional regulator [Bacteroidota bacterium]
MSVPILTTKLFIPTLRTGTILRPRLIEKLNKGLLCKLTLISASAGFGKTTLVSEWVSHSRQKVLWLSLDEEHKDPMRFLAYIVTALQSIKENIGIELLIELQSPQSPYLDYILPHILNEITAIIEDFILVLDDYHILDNEEIDKILTFFLKHMPSQMHLVIATREDPHLPMARLRGIGQLTEIRASDLRFSVTETTAFLNEMMHLSLSASDITALETRTEGWIAGLQLAAISMQGHNDSSKFIESFTGNHHFILDYMIEEVLNQQEESIQSFLIRTAILDRMCGPLCEHVLNDPALSGRETLKNLEQLNMFIIPLDNDRHWYRYHHLFGELLKLRLKQSAYDTEELHIRASQWYEDNELYIEAFQHSTAAGDINRTIRLLEGKNIPRTSRRTVSMILNWLHSLPEDVLDQYPILWITYASVLLGMGQISGVESKLNIAEAALNRTESNEATRDLIGRIATMRAILAVTRYDSELIYTQSLKALEYLHKNNFSSRITSTWTLGQAYQQMGRIEEAKKTYRDAIKLGMSSGNYLFAIMSESGIGDIEEADNKLHSAAEIYGHVIEQVGKQPLPVMCDVYLGLARIHYEWNNLEKARQLAETSLKLAKKFENVIDRFILVELFLVRLNIVEKKMEDASVLLHDTVKTVQQDNFKHRKSIVAETQILLKIKQGDFKAAEQLAAEFDLKASKVRILLASGDVSSALNVLKPLNLQIDKKKRDKESLKIKILQALALFENGESGMAVQIMGKILPTTEPEGFIRIFVDEGLPMFRLLAEAAKKGITPDYITQIQAEYNSVEHKKIKQPLIEPLSQRELEVLNLLSQGLSNKDICNKLFLALDTVKGHNRRIYAKLDVKTRTMAISKARDLNILS